MKFERFEEGLKQLMRFGELKLDIWKKDKGWKIVVIEYSLDTWYDLTTGAQSEPEESNMVLLTIHTDNDGLINFIEHPFHAFTRVNAEQVKLVLALIGLTVEGLSEDLSTYGQDEK